MGRAKSKSRGLTRRRAFLQICIQTHFLRRSMSVRVVRAWQNEGSLLDPKGTPETRRGHQIRAIVLDLNQTQRKQGRVAMCFWKT